MPHDAKGVPLKAGDEVLFRAVIESVSQSETECNITANVIDQSSATKDETYRPTLSLNSKFAEKCERPARDEFARKLDGSLRHSHVYMALRHFRYDHLPAHLQTINRPFCQLAVQLADTLPEGNDLTAGLRKLLDAMRNCAGASLSSDSAAETGEPLADGELNPRVLEITHLRGKPFAGYLYLPRTNDDEVVCSDQRAGIIIDYTADRRAIGIEVPAFPPDIISQIQHALDELQQPLLSPEEYAPLAACVSA